MSLDLRSGNDLQGTRMTHSLSTPSGVDGVMTSHGGKKLAVRIQMLDDSITMFQVQSKAMGKVLFEQVCRQLNLLEEDYFGLEYRETGSTTYYWLDLEKPMNRQVGLSLIEPMFRFCVKFYTPDPSQLEEEFTRYLFCLQIKRDLATGVFQCNENTAALMASYIVQASCGDYAAEDYPDHTYLSSYRFVPHQDSAMQHKIMENHKKHVGQSPAEADLNLLETARRCELYGMKMHPAKDVEGVPLYLAVAHMGLAIFQNLTRINTFSWAKIRKISFKRKKFLIKLHPEGFGYHRDIVEFFFNTRNECKNFWKKCVENHGFFRCQKVQRIPRTKTRVLSRGSSFRYSGKTQKQIVEYVRDNYVKRQNFQRSQSFRQGPLQSSSRSQSHNSCNVNSSISAHPLLPIETATDWDSTRETRSLTRPSQMKREAELPTRPLDSPTDRNQYQSTAAQVEIYPMKKYARAEYPQPVQDPLDSSRSVSPTTWNSPNHYHSMREVDQGRAHQDVHNTGSMHGINGNVSLDRREVNHTVHSTPLVNPYQTKSFSHTDMSGSQEFETLRTNNNLSSNDKTLSIEFNENDLRKRKLLNNKAYFLAKEILLTERTYKKDLSIINTSFREELSDDIIDMLQPLFQLAETMVQHHNIFLRDLEHRLLMWESRSSMSDVQRIGDILLKNMVVLPVYDEYIENIYDILQRLDELYENDERFQQLYTNFEQQKICYLPLTYIIMKPLHRLLHYQLILEQLMEFYEDEHIDKTDCFGTLTILSRTTKVIMDVLPETENYVQLCELQRDLSGFDSLVNNERNFIRQGCLLKHSKRGLQQKIFFLFSDILLYGSKSPTSQTFKILGYVPVRSLLTENSEHNSFIIFGGQKAITVSASTTAEKTLWLAELSKAAADCKNTPSDQIGLLSLKNCSSSEEGLETCGLNSFATVKQPATRNNNALYVCWHRGATVSLRDHLTSTENQLSGYLLRKFKNSSGWQKLWVVFTSFCLYFYKNYQDDIALASLPLLGYSVGPPSSQDEIQKDFVFKLSFKNHVYFFRAESDYTYNRWLQVLRSTTQTQDFKNIHN